MDVACPAISRLEYIWLIDLYREKVKGNLPYSGGVLEQPAILMEAINILEKIIGKT